MGQSKWTLEAVEEALATLGAMKEALLARESVEQLRVEADAELEAAQARWDARFSETPVPPPVAPPDSLGRKSNVQIFEETLLANGHPMYVKALYEAALSRGLALRGTKASPTEQVRNSLSGSKRFTNLGDNVWWLAGHPLEDTSPVT